MNASVNIERNSWRLPPDETVQVADPRSKSAQVKEVNRSTGSHSSGLPPSNRRVLASPRVPYIQYDQVETVHVHKCNDRLEVDTSRRRAVAVINLRVQEIKLHTERPNREAN